MVHPVGRQRVPQRFGDVVLPDDLGEGLRPVTAVEGEGCIHVCSLTTKEDSGRRVVAGLVAD
jgi:hypothetical protein